MIVLFTVVALSFLGFFLHLWRDPKPHTKGRVVELLLLYQLIFNVGVMSLLGFYGHTFIAEQVATYLGWQASPFQQELANANLGFAVLGFLSIWLRGHFWTATIIGSSIWLIGDAIDHVLHIVLHNNYSAGNVGFPLFSDFLSPVLLIVLLILYLKWVPQSKR